MARPGFRSGVVFVLAVLSCLFYLWPRDLLLRDSLPEDLSIELDAPNHPETIDAPEPTTRQNNGLTDVVEWDEYSLFIHNQRVFIWCVLLSVVCLGSRTDSLVLSSGLASSILGDCQS